MSQVNINVPEYDNPAAQLAVNLTSQAKQSLSKNAIGAQLIGKVEDLKGKDIAALGADLGANVYGGVKNVLSRNDIAAQIIEEIEHLNDTVSEAELRRQTTAPFSQRMKQFTIRDWLVFIITPISICSFMYIFGFLVEVADKSLTTIPAGHVGVAQRWGKIVDDVLEPGLNTKVPWVDVIHVVNTKIKTITYEGEAFSYDLQHIYATIDVQYSIAPSLAPKMFTNIGDRKTAEKMFVPKAIAESLKAITCKYTSTELVYNRPVVKEEVRAMVINYLSSSIEDYGMDQLFEIQNVLLTNFEFTDYFNQAIEEKVKTDQEVLQAKHYKDRTITDAEAEQERQQMKADAEAYEIKTVAQAKANAIVWEAQALSDEPDYYKLRLLEKWNGELPEFLIGQGNGTVPSATFPIIDLQWDG